MTRITYITINSNTYCIVGGDDDGYRIYDASRKECFGTRRTMNGAVELCERLAHSG